MKSAPHFCQILTKFDISLHIFIKASNIKIGRNPYSGNRAYTRRETNRRTDSVKDGIKFLFHYSEEIDLIAIQYRQKSETRLRLRVYCPIFLANFKEIRIYSTDIHKSAQYQISWQYVQWEPRCDIQTEGEAGGET